MSSKILESIVSDPRKKVNESTNALARLYRTILMDREIDYLSLSRCIDNYLKKQQNEKERSTKDQTREKGNLVKELSNDSLTWKNFVKGIQILNPVKVDLDITIWWTPKRNSVHKVSMAIRNSDDESEE